MCQKEEGLGKKGSNILYENTIHFQCHKDLKMPAFLSSTLLRPSLEHMDYCGTLISIITLGDSLITIMNVSRGLILSS